MDLSRLTKLLALTASESDGEALNAIRAANAFLKKHSLTWSQIGLSLSAAAPRQPHARPDPYDNPFARGFDDEFMEILRQARRNSDINRQQRAQEEAARKQANSNDTQLLGVRIMVCIEYFTQKGEWEIVRALQSIRDFYHKRGYLPHTDRDLLMRFWNTVKENTK